MLRSIKYAQYSITRMVIIRIKKTFPIIRQRKVEIKSKIKRILIPLHSPAFGRHVYCFGNANRHGDHVMVRDVIHCSRFFQNWRSPGLIIYIPYFEKFCVRLCYLKMWPFLLGPLAHQVYSEPQNYEVKEQCKNMWSKDCLLVKY